MALMGVGVGIAVGLLCARWVGSLLIQLSADDPLTFAAAAGFLCAVALLATLLPAGRAATTAPTTALRND